MTYERLIEAASTIASLSGRQTHDVAIVLGSGLSDHAGALPQAVSIPYASIPGFPVPKVEGHAGTLVSSDLGSVRVLAFAGRVHTYEGWDMADVVFGVRAAILTGCRTVVLTNAAGGCGDGLEPGDLVLITDHLNLTGRNPLTGANDARLGPRFADMSDVYTTDLRAIAHTVADDAGVMLKDGVYAWFLGPSYETPAEVQMAKRLGADLVGMSTVPEAIAARHMGAEVVGISLVTNLAAGISPVPLSHAEVTETAAKAHDRFTTLVDALLPALVTDR